MLLLLSCRDAALTAGGPVPVTIPATATPGTPVPRITAEVSGTLTFVDSTRRIINVKTSTDDTLVLSISYATRVTSDGADLALADFGQYIGSKVTAEYYTANGIAASVEVE